MLEAYLVKQSKITDLIGRIEKSMELHALVLCEAWLTPDTRKLLKINNFSYSGIKRKDKKGSGVAFLINNKLVSRDCEDLKINTDHMEHHIIEVKCRYRYICWLIRVS